MSIAGEWYSSGTFWSAAAVVVTLLVGVATVAVTYLTRFARQRLEYGLRTVAPLLTAPDGVRDDLELRHRGVRLEQPHLVEVVLAGSGRRDIPGTSFDNGDPIRLDLGVPIVELLQITADDSASATPTPPVHAVGTALLVGPALIGRRQHLTLTALVQGEPSLRCEAPLPNARVRRGVHAPEATRERLRKLQIVLVVLGAATVVLLLQVTGLAEALNDEVKRWLTVSG